jgi:hypothetical protein
VTFTDDVLRIRFHGDRSAESMIREYEMCGSLFENGDETRLCC